jgi:hypothetical protein
MYQNPVLNAPLGPDGLPVQVAPEEVMEHYEVSSMYLVWVHCWQQWMQRMCR